MATLLTVDINPAQLRNAREQIQTRVQGATTLLDDPVVIREVSATSLEVQLPDALPAEELRSIIAGLANLVNRPESGITGNVQVNPENSEGIQRRYSV
jgi:hypothetical protein